MTEKVAILNIQTGRVMIKKEKRKFRHVWLDSSSLKLLSCPVTVSDKDIREYLKLKKKQVHFLLDEGREGLAKGKKTYDYAGWLDLNWVGMGVNKHFNYFCQGIRADDLEQLWDEVVAW